MYKLVAIDEQTGQEYKFDNVLLYGCWTRETIEIRIKDELSNNELEVSEVELESMVDEVCGRVEGNSEMIDGETLDYYINDVIEEYEREEEN